MGRKGERAGAHHAEHIAKVGACRHLDVFYDVADYLAAFKHALLQNEQIVFQQDDVGRLFGNIHGQIHRNTDISGFQRRRVVDAVPHLKPTMIVLAQRGDEISSLCAGESLAKTAFSSTALESCSGVIASGSEPSTTCSTGKFT